MLPPAYKSGDYEDEIYKKWEESGVFKADATSDKPPFTISMPPPNATGTLHLGHSLMLAIQDVFIRHRRMKGYEALWLPGTDHASIATESVVIKKIKNEERIKDPRSLGREKLVNRIAQFVEKSQGTIRSQLRKMGASCDWSRERYTMDQSLNRCVNEVFKKMYDDGLIYRGDRVVNWDTALQTTISDDEVIHNEQEGVLYVFEYLSTKQTGGDPLYVGTSRPETKLGDNAIAVHPDDERYKHLIGRHFDVLWPGGQKITVTVIADHEIDAEFGTGALGVTPFHSKIDYDMWLRHKDSIKAHPIHVINEQGRITDQITGYEGLTVLEAREKFVEELRSAGLMKEEKKYIQQMAISYRSKKPIEPLPKLQWFIDVNKQVVNWKGKKMSLRQIMQSVIREGDINIIPDRFRKTYFHWIDNLQDWCISRQIWWGHRIPVWYKDDDIYVDIKAPEEAGYKQDSDTLDTWFSAALWTWSTLINPDLTADESLSLQDLFKKSVDFQKFHSTQVMETGYDILFFWIARMILMTTYAVGEIPFETVYLHGLIRTREGKKMSKSDPKTCIDPLDMISKYGADALRMSMLIGNTPGNDMRLYEDKIKAFRNFTNKLWNASRFVLGIFEEKNIKDEPEIYYNRLSSADEWILNKLNHVIKKSDDGLMNFRISEVGQILYDFLWNDFCDWYLELSKGESQNPAVLYYVLKNILILLHPFTPFVTEQIWSHLPGQTDMLIGHSYSEPDDRHHDVNSMENIIEVIKKIRSMRSENKINPADKIPVTIYTHDKLNDFEKNKEELIRLARISELTLEVEGQRLSNSAADVVHGIEIFIPLNGLIDPEKEKARLQSEIGKIELYIKGLKSKLSNNKFVDNAPAQVIESERIRLKESEGKLKKLKGQLGSF